MKREKKDREKQKEQKAPKQKWEYDLDQSYKMGALVNQDEFEKETTYSIMEPVIPRWVTSTGSAWYNCGFCDKELPSKDWTSHWKTASH